MKNIKWKYSVGDVIKTERQNFKITDKEIRDKTKKSKTSISGYCHEYQKWYEYICLTCGTEKLWVQENCITSKKGCPICNKLRQNSHSPWLYEINQKIIDNTRDLIITERKIIERKQKSNTNKSGILTHYEKYYKYKCNKCGYSDGWKVESSIKAGQGCACCSIPAKVVVSGVNDIPTTDPWMIPYFQGKEQEASLYTAGSMKKLNFQCPDCGKIRKKKIAIGTLKINKSIGCECSDSISYPETFFKLQ